MQFPCYVDDMLCATALTFYATVANVSNIETSLTHTAIRAKYVFFNHHVANQQTLAAASNGLETVISP